MRVLGRNVSLGLFTSSSELASCEKKTWTACSVVPSALSPLSASSWQWSGLPLHMKCRAGGTLQINVVKMPCCVIFPRQNKTTIVCGCLPGLM